MKFHSTVLFVSNIETAKSFYTNFLEFKIEHDFGNNVLLNNGLSLWAVQSGHTISDKLKTKLESNKFELYFESDNIDKIFKKLKDGEVKFLHEIKEEPWGQRTLRFFDPDQHLIEIGEPLEVFVQNMFMKGMTEPQISEKSGIPLNTVKQLLG